MARVMPRTRSGRFIKLLGDGKALLLDKEDSLDGVEVTLWRKGDEERAKETKSLTPEEVRQKFDFTPAERAAYNEKVRASEGFDVGDVPSRVNYNVIRPVHYQNDPLALQQGFGDMSKLALGVYNQNKGTHYQFVKVIRVNYMFTGAFSYYITFQAQNVMAGSSHNNFQALMCSGQGPNRDETKVEFCRVEPKPESESDLLEGPSETSVQQQ